MRCFLILILFTSYSLSAQTELSVEVGDTCPEWKLELEDGSRLYFDSIATDYTLMLFWHYKCSHCQKALTKIDKFIEEEAPNNLKIVSIFPFSQDKKKFWRYVNDPENLLTDSIFIHSTDIKAGTRRAFSQAGAPPLLILLDKQGKILALNFKANKLTSIWKEEQKKSQN